MRSRSAAARSLIVPFGALGVSVSGSGINGKDLHLTIVDDPRVDDDGNVRLGLVQQGVRRMLSRCRECGGQWVWHKYLSRSIKQPLYSRCAECAASEHNRIVRRRWEFWTSSFGGSSLH